jgi:hypothetical protein
MTPPGAIPVRDDTCNDPPPAPLGRTCLLCPAPRRSGRGRYCSDACRQRAFRLRHTPQPAPDEQPLRAALRRRALLAAHTIYECPACEGRLLGERRCPDCNRFCRALGLGGACPECEQPLLLSDLVDLEV